VALHALRLRHFHRITTSQKKLRPPSDATIGRQDSHFGRFAQSDAPQKAPSVCDGGSAGTLLRSRSEPSLPFDCQLNLQHGQILKVSLVDAPPCRLNVFRGGIQGWHRSPLMSNNWRLIGCLSRGFAWMRSPCGRSCPETSIRMIAAVARLTPIVAISSFLLAYLPISHTKCLDHACSRRLFECAVKALHA
jgi:hypothetical protein